MARHIKKGDQVEVIAGDSKGVTGKVMRVLPDKDRVLVEGVNMVQKHVRPSQRNPQGGRIRVERPIHISNVLPVNPKTSQRHPGAVCGRQPKVSKNAWPPTAARSV
jgi:large subunit ribosomal protein L24